MRHSFRCSGSLAVVVLALFFMVGGLRAQEGTVQPTPGAVSATADDLYHQALEAYLDGNYDQSILLAAQSLQKDPANAKSKNLLGVLTAEKEKAAKTVIWLPGAADTPVPTPVAAEPAPAPDTSGLQKDVQGLQAKVERIQGDQTRRNREVNGQIQVVQQLIRDNSKGQFEEVQKSQIEIVNRLQKLETHQGPDLRLLYILCGASVLFSAAAIWRGPQKTKRS